MAMIQGSGVTAAHRPRTPIRAIHEEFSPVTEWKEEGKSRILLVYLPGFRKEHLKVATEGTNTLRIRGERVVAGNKSKRFQGEYQIPVDSTIRGIHAKFEAGLLTITIPKKDTTQLVGPKSEDAKTTQDSPPVKEIIDKPKEVSHEAPGPEEAMETTLVSKKKDGEQINKESAEGKEESSRRAVIGKGIEDTLEGKERIGRSEKWKEIDQEENDGFNMVNLKKAMKGFASGRLMKEKRGLMVSVGLAFIVVAALGAYMSYTLGSYEETSNP